MSFQGKKEYWLYEKNTDTRKERLFTDGEDSAQLPTPVTCRHPFYYNINKHQGLEKRIYWVESTHIPPPFQNNKSSIKIKFKSCGNGQYTMEQKKRGRKTGFRSKRRENVNMKTSLDVFDPFIDKFSLIKARRHRFEQNNERKTIFTPKKPFKEKEKPPSSAVVNNEVGINDLHVKYESKDFSKVTSTEHVTIDLKRVGFNFIDGKVDDKLLYSSISHYFKKRPNISLRRIDRKDLSTLRKDGFIKTESCDPTNKENNPEKTGDCKADILAKKGLIITPEHLSKIKSKLKAVTYEKSKPNPSSTVKKYAEEHTSSEMGLSRDEAPNIVDDNQNTLVSVFQESHQPPILIPEMNSFEDDINSSDKETPFVYLETKPDVEELDRKIQSLESSKRSVNGKILDRQLSAMIEKGSQGSNCRQLEVFVCKRSTEECFPVVNDCKDKVDCTFEMKEDSKNTSDKGSNDIESSNKLVSSKKKKSQAKLTSEILVPKSYSSPTYSLFHSGISSTETTIGHSVSHVITDVNSSSNSGSHNSSIPANYHLESNSIAKDAETVLTSMDLESGDDKCLDGSNETISLENAAKEINTSSHDRCSPTVYPNKSSKIFRSPHSIPSLASVNSLFPKEPCEAACGYDSDETLVYDEEEEEGLCEKLLRKNQQMFSRSSLPHSNCEILDSVKGSSVKKTIYKKMNEHNSLKTHFKPLKTRKRISDRENGDISGKKAKVKMPPLKRKQKANNETESQDLLLTISPNKRPVGNRGHKQSEKMSSSCIKLLDIFSFEDSSEKQRMKTKKPLSPKYDDKVLRNRRSRSNKAETKKKKALQSKYNAKTSYGEGRMNTKDYTVIDNIDEDDLPKILPPKRRRNSKNNAAMKKKSAVVPDDMERLIQEFPRHNWLENKYKSDETPRNHPEEIQTTEELYEYSLDEDKMDTTDLGEENQSTTETVNPVINEHDARSNQQNAFSLEATETSESNPSDEQEDIPDEDRLQIVTDLDKDGQDNEVMIPCTVPSTMTEVTSESPHLNQVDQNSTVDTEADDQGKITEEPVEPVVSTAQEEITEHPRATNSTLPPVPHLIKAPDSNQDDLHSSNMLASPNPESFENVTINQPIAEQVCTSSISYGSASVPLTESCSTPTIVDSVLLNKDCIASTMPSEGQNVNTRKRRYNGEESHERDRSYADMPTSDHISEKNPKLSSKVIDINNWKEIITAKVKNDINNQLQKTLTEFRELDQMATEKAREAESLRQLREQKLRDLQSIQKNNSEAEIKRILNERLSMLERQPEMKSEINSPPPAHQRPKQNIRELLDKMDRSHSQTPIDCSTFSAFSARKTPLHSPNASMSGKPPTSAHTYTHVPSVRNDDPNSETGIIQGNVPPAHETEQSGAIRASSAPVICNRTSLDKQSTVPDIRVSVSNRVNTVISNSRLCNGSKPGVNTPRPSEAYIDLSQSSKDSEREIQRELSRALAVKRQKQDSSAKHDVYKSKEITVNRLHHQNGEPFGTRQTIQPSNPQLMLSAKSKEIRGYPQNTYTQQLVRPVSYATITNSQNLNTEKTVSGAYRQNIPGMMRPHAVRLLGATAVGNVQQTLDGRQAFTSYASTIPLNTFPNTGSIRQGTPIRQVQGIVSPTQPHVRPPLSSGAAPLENGQLLRHIPITAARTIDDIQKAPYVQQAAISSTGQPSMRPQGYLRPLAPINSAKPQVGALKSSNNTKMRSDNTEILLNSSQQQQQQLHHHQQTNMHMNINGKCIVCSKFALYLCSNCQQFWYCSPQCQLKHWVNHQHHCKTASKVS
ncbi:uncharacterized protein LOC133205028 [Saccostrea echinata]|uniref:uncharacterized protein LOC133205028 n=1 Tax=Saccostrea echinata TaxID=191078 RepID=UPI002A83ECDB|nr:uncharacterized protein LOC133205028 [Saccostrea echinata]